MIYRLLADVLVIVHLLFILFALFGAFMALRWRWLWLVHVPVVIWGVLVEVNHWICPLTPLEYWLRLKGGESGYQESFVEHYIVPIVYPTNLTETMQYWAAAVLIVINVFAYALLIYRRQH